MDKSRDRGLILEAASPSVFRTNGFRLLRMPVDASPRLLKKRSSDLRLLLEIPDDDELHIQPLFPFDRVLLVHPLALDDIRGIEQRLQDSQRRLLEEFFWFWPDSARSGSEDGSLTAVASGEIATAVSLWSKAERIHGAEGCAARHNLSVYYYACVLNHESYLIDGQPRSPKREEILDAVAPLWENCLGRWDSIMRTDEEWNLLRSRVESLADPRLDVGFVDTIRDALPQALDQVNADLAVAFADRGDGASVSRHIAFIRQTQSDLDDITQTLSDATRKQRERIVASMADMTRRVTAEPATGADVILQSLASVRQDAQTVQLLLGNSRTEMNAVTKRTREDQTLQVDLADTLDQIADEVITCQVTYSRATKDWGTSLTILQEAKRYATSEKARERLQENLKIVEGNSVYADALAFWLRLEGQVERTAVTPSSRLAAFKERALPVVREILIDSTKSGALRQEIGDAAAAFLHRLSLAANNAFGDVDTAISILGEALKVAKSSELMHQLSSSKELLSKRIVDANAAAVSFRRGGTMSESDWDNVWEMTGDALRNNAGAWQRAAWISNSGYTPSILAATGKLPYGSWLPSTPSRAELPAVFPFIVSGFTKHASVGMDFDIDSETLHYDGKSYSCRDMTGFAGGFPTVTLRTAANATCRVDFRRLCSGLDQAQEPEKQLLMGVAHGRATSALNALAGFVFRRVTRTIVYAVLEGAPYRLAPPEGPSLLLTREYVEYPDPTFSLWRRKPPVRIPLEDVQCLVKDGTVTVQESGESDVPPFTCKVDGTWNTLVIDDAITMIRDYVRDNNITFEPAPDTGIRRTT